MLGRRIRVTDRKRLLINWFQNREVMPGCPGRLTVITSLLKDGRGAQTNRVRVTRARVVDASASFDDKTGHARGLAACEKGKKRVSERILAPNFSPVGPIFVC